MHPGQHPYGDTAQPEEVWPDVGALKSPPPQRGVYVGITGNTGCGKSTLVRHLTQRLKLNNPLVVGINERSFHHPLLQAMFFSPRRFAFGVQVNFALQRHLAVYAWLEAGYTVIIERCHLDDPIFVRHHFRMGHISSTEYFAYRTLSHSFRARLRVPDILVCLDASAKLSQERVTMAENAGERPHEFPNEETKWEFISGWAKAYQRHFSMLERLRRISSHYSEMNVIRFDAQLSTESIAITVANVIQGG